MDPLWIYLLFINASSFLLMGFDKFSAKAKTERVPELWFFLLSLAGGFGGILFGILTFHHKISKASFQLKIGAAAIPAIVILIFLVMRM